VGPFLIFFDWDKDAVTSDASQILDRAIEQFRQTGQTSVALAGYTDTSGKASYNMGLSIRRAEHTKAYMTAHGVPDNVIMSQGFGETKLAVETADGVREPQNRRVEITMAGAPAANPQPVCHDEPGPAPGSSDAPPPPPPAPADAAPPPPPQQ